MGEGDASIRDLFRVARPSVPDLRFDDAGWEDDQTHPRHAAELVEGLTVRWGMLEDCLRRQTTRDLNVGFRRQRASGARTVTRGWVVWHVLKNDIHQAGEISQILGSNGLPPLAM